MQDLIKRNFWVIGALTVVICAVFAAKATGSILTAKFLGDPTTGPKITPVTQVAKTDDAPARDKTGTPLQSRNIFCSDCAPPEPMEPTNSGSTDASGVVITSLPLQLLATSVGSTDKSSYASVANTATQAAGSYGIDDTLPGATGKIIAIRYKYVDFTHNGHTERLVIDGAVAAPPVVAVAEPEKTDENKDDLASSVESGIKKIDDTTFEIDKSLVEKALENPMALAKGARIVPAMKNGKAEGFKLYAIRPSSVFAKLGLSNGDTLTAINGFELTTADKALEVYTKLREATNLELEVTRRGKPVTLKYSIK